MAEGRGTAVERRAPVSSGRTGRSARSRFATPMWPRSICTFLALEAADGDVRAGAPGVDTANRCTAIGEPLPSPARQQELVCLTAAHVNCPRYLRGVLVAEAPPPPPAREPVSPAVIGAALVLVAALAASFGFLAVRGGFDLPTASPSPALAARGQPVSGADRDGDAVAAATSIQPEGEPGRRRAPSPRAHPDADPDSDTHAADDRGARPPPPRRHQRPLCAADEVPIDAGLLDLWRHGGRRGRGRRRRGRRSRGGRGGGTRSGRQRRACARARPRAGRGLRRRRCDAGRRGSTGMGS